MVDLIPTWLRCGHQIDLNSEALSFHVSKESAIPSANDRWIGVIA